MAKVLVIGSGGREHALGWKLKQSPRVSQLFFLPGNGGTSQIGTNINITVTENEKIVEWSKENKIDLVVVAPDDPLARGLVDDLEESGIKAFGSSKKASEIEWSKAFAKILMKEENIPTAKFETFSDFELAKKYLDSQRFPIVIKASGLALGKGVTIAKNRKEAILALDDAIVKKVFGDSGSEVVIEEFLEGFEVSFHVFCDGESYSLFPVSQDHKQILDGDKGPNTGGMGTIAPVPQVHENLIKEVEEKIIKPTLKGLKKKGTEFKGILYPGIMVTKDGPKVLEFNARFGDPETETYMRLLDSDLFEIFNSCIDGNLKDLEIKWRKDFACTIVLVSKGYPQSSEKGIEITGIEEAEKDSEIIVFHSGTIKEDISEVSSYFHLRGGKLLTNGGRVLGVSSIGKTLEEALEKAHKAIEKIKFKGMQYRKDIGKRENWLYN